MPSFANRPELVCPKCGGKKFRHICINIIECKRCLEKINRDKLEKSAREFVRKSVLEFLDELQIDVTQAQLPVGMRPKLDGIIQILKSVSPTHEYIFSLTGKKYEYNELGDQAQSSVDNG